MQALHARGCVALLFLIALLLGIFGVLRTSPVLTAIDKVYICFVSVCLILDSLTEAFVKHSQTVLGAIWSFRAKSCMSCEA